MDELRPNSHKYKTEQKEAVEEKKNIEKIVTGQVKTKKKSEFSKWAGTFISEDAKNVKSYILTDVVIPGIKKIICDTVVNTIETLFYGGSRRGSSSSIASKVSYRDYSRRSDDRRDTSEARTKTGYNYDDIVVESRGEAEDVLCRMGEIIEEYGHVSVADLYDLVGITGNYTDNKYGWTNVRNADVRRVRDGYMLLLPKVLPLN